MQAFRRHFLVWSDVWITAILAILAGLAAVRDVIAVFFRPVEDDADNLVRQLVGHTQADHFVLLAIFLLATGYLVYRANRHTRFVGFKKSTAHTHKSVHILRDIEGLLLQANNNELSKEEALNRSAEMFGAAMNSMCDAFDSISKSKCTVSVKVLAEREVEGQSVKVAQTFVRDKRSLSEREQACSTESDQELDWFEKNTHYKELLSSNGKWLIRFDDRNDPKMKNYDMPTLRMWETHKDLEPRARMYAAIAIEWPARKYNGDGAVPTVDAFDFEGIIYVDSDKAFVFDESAEELLHAYADALFNPLFAYNQVASE